MSLSEASPAEPPFPTKSYTAAMERLVGVVEELSHAHDLDSIMAIVRRAARELTGADGATFVLRDGDKCYYAEENAISPLWKGQRFPLVNCISGWAMLNAQPAVIEDIYQDPRIPADAYRPTFVKSLAMVPIRTKEPVGAIGNYWATQRMPSKEEVSILQALANVTSVAMENVDLYIRLQEKLVALEDSNGELSRFAWIASHDLKSPLRAIDNLSQWIEEDLGDNLQGNARKHMTALRQRVHRMDRFLDDILEYAQIDRKLAPHQGEMVDGKTLIQDIHELINLPPSFTLTFPDNFADLRLPRLPLQRVFCNLINNAVKHHDRPDGTVSVGIEDNGPSYIFTVKDDGPGIAPQYRQQIFEMFQTLQTRNVRESTGMGLALVKKILLLYGGTITVESNGGRGSVFRFIWPKSLES